MNSEEIVNNKNPKGITSDDQSPVDIQANLVAPMEIDTEYHMCEQNPKEMNVECQVGPRGNCVPNAQSVQSHAKGLAKG